MTRIGAGLVREDVAHQSGEQGLQALAVRSDVLASKTNLDGDYAPLQVNSRGALYTQAAGAASFTRNIDVDETADLQVNTACSVSAIRAYNAHATDVRFLKLYDKATAATVGTDTPVATFPIKAGEALEIAFPVPVRFALGLSVGATTGVADNNTGAPGANDVVFAAAYV